MTINVEKSGRTSSYSRPPDVIDQAQKIIHSFSMAGGSIDRCFGNNNVPSAANWFVNGLMKPQAKTEKSRRYRIGHSDTHSWDTPYNDRIVQSLLTYIRLSESDQSYIRAARDDGIFWNGDFWCIADPLKTFRLIVDAATEMNAVGAETYSNKTLKRLRQLLVDTKFD